MYLSNRPAAYPAPPRFIVVRGPNGVLRGLGLGDAPSPVLDQAKQALINAGYQGAECRTETVYYPNGGGGSYTQNICSAPGYDGGFDAGLALKMTPAQLAAQRAYELNSGMNEGKLQDYFQSTAGAPNISVGATTGPAAAGQTSVKPNWMEPAVPVPGVKIPAPTPVTVSGPSAGGTPPPPVAPPAGSASLENFLGTAVATASSLGSIGGFPIWAVGLGALALLPLVFGGGSRR